jgi:hypothetical protein
LQVCERSESPYEPTPLPQPTKSSTVRVGVWLLGAVTLASIIWTVFLFVSRPDIERFLTQTIPGRHMPDAFDRLNESVPIFFIFLTISLVVMLLLALKQLYSLFIPLIAGPAMCVVGWYMTENFDDPNWFHLFALATIGMLVSCLVTTVLAGMSKKTTEPRIAPKLR